MTRPHSLELSYVVLVLRLLSCTAGCHASDQERKIYIVYMGNLGESEQSTSTYHQDMLQEVVDNRFRGKPLVTSYTRNFNGFSAFLTHEEQKKLARKEGVVSIFPSTTLTLQLQTTRPWGFTGLPENFHRNPTVESDTIDGIWPESESSNDKGFSAPPKKWRGLCKGGQNFTCNKHSGRNLRAAAIIFYLVLMFDFR